MKKCTYVVIRAKTRSQKLSSLIFLHRVRLLKTAKIENYPYGSKLLRSYEKTKRVEMKFEKLFFRRDFYQNQEAVCPLGCLVLTKLRYCFQTDRFNFTLQKKTILHTLPQFLQYFLPPLIDVRKPLGSYF